MTRFLSVCSGIEAASVAWGPLGWRAHAFAEIEAFPSAVLAERHPGIPNWGDMTKFKDWPDAAIDILVGGTPCQSFSVAGLRKGMADPRGNLALTYLAIADRCRPEWLAWENVPGVLSSSGGRDFGAFLGGLGELGYGFAYRVLDAQYVRVDGFARAVPQRRRRVFVVGHLGDWRRAAAVLFEPESLSGHSAPRREAGKGIAGCLSPGAHPGGFNGQDAYADQLIAFDTTQITSKGNYSNPQPGDPCHPLAAGAHPPAVVFSATHDVAGTMMSYAKSGGDSNRIDNAASGYMAVAEKDWAVRRLTPTECERLQGFPEIHREVIIQAWNSSDLRQFDATAEALNHKSRLPASVAEESASSLTAGTAAKPSNTSRHGLGLHVVLSVQIDLERSAVEIRRAGKLLWSASTAELPSSSPLSMPLDGFVRAVALMNTIAVPPTLLGEVASPANISGSSTRQSGSVFVSASGREIDALVKDADWFTETASLCMRSTTSPSGQSSPTSEQTLATFASFVVAAISSCIPTEIRTASSYAVTFETVCGYTAITYRGKPAADGPRYKALGNSMAVNAMRWIGQRIELVNGIVREQREAA